MVKGKRYVRHQITLKGHPLSRCGPRDEKDVTVECWSQYLALKICTMIVGFRLLVGERFAKHLKCQQPKPSLGVGGRQSAAGGLAFPGTVFWGPPVQKAGLTFRDCFSFTAISGALQTSRSRGLTGTPETCAWCPLGLGCGEDKPGSRQATIHAGGSGWGWGDGSERITAWGHETSGFLPALAILVTFLANLSRSTLSWLSEQDRDREAGLEASVALSQWEGARWALRQSPLLAAPLSMDLALWGHRLCKVGPLHSRVWGSEAEKDVGPTFKVMSKGSRAALPTGTTRVEGGLQWPQRCSVALSPSRTG